MTETETVLTHPTFGKLRGMKSPDGKTAQYRGLKYASIPGRWKDPLPLNELERKYGDGEGEEEFDATKHGPQCPQHAGGFAFDLSLIGKGLDLKRDQEDQDEFECLNLVITVPDGVNGEGDGLPVLVLVHGGGFSVGANSWPQYDLARLVTTSAKIGQPIIGVSINYRLGPFGWLASSELGIDGNYGLKDQACAFKWIQKHISPFGGNPAQITSIGESAGSICLAHLLQLSPTPLFNAAILMSGDSTLRRARTVSWQNKHYHSNLSHLSLSNHPVAERVEILRSLPAQDLVARLPMFQHWSPSIDGVFLRGDVDLGRIANLGKKEEKKGKKEWCRRVMMGDCLHDGTVLKARIMDSPTVVSRLHDSLNSCLSPAQAGELLTAYNLYGALTPKQQFHGLLQLASDLRFYFPILMWEEGWLNSGKGEGWRRYHFHLPNPLEGGMKGWASHELDLGVLLGNFRELRAKDDGLGGEMRKLVLGFVCGERTSDDEVLVFGGREDGDADVVQRVKREEYDRVYRGGRGEMLRRFGWENVFKLGELLQGCRGEEEELDRKKRGTSKL